MMEEIVIHAFNAKIEQYFGINVKGANVKALVNSVNANNKSQDDDSKKITIIDNNGIIEENGGSYNAIGIKNEKTYIVEGTEYDNEGYLSVVTITENSN